jgi:hypothetical protein
LALQYFVGRNAVELANKEILKDWTRVENFPVDDREHRDFEFHVVKDIAAKRIMLTIKCFNEDSQTVRLDPTVISETSDPEAFTDIAQRRVRQLYSDGRI